MSVAAGVRAADIAEAFRRPAARVMPITAVAVAKGAGGVFAEDPRARAAAHALFDPVATLVDIDDEALMDAVTGVCGSAPAYLYAFTEALEAAGEAAGLPPEASRALARATMAGAAALMAASGEEPSELRRQVTSPNGTTEAALKVLMGEGGLGPLLKGAVAHQHLQCRLGGAVRRRDLTAQLRRLLARRRHQGRGPGLSLRLHRGA